MYLNDLRHKSECHFLSESGVTDLDIKSSFWEVLKLNI
jgi:hypothetical protein